MRFQWKLHQKIVCQELTFGKILTKAILFEQQLKLVQGQMTYYTSSQLDHAKLRHMRQNIQKKNSVFSKKDILDSANPDCIIGRQNEAISLLTYLDPSVENYLPPFVEVYGRSGSGKSCVVELVCREISDSVSYRIVNLKRARTIFGCASLIAEGLGGEPVSKYTGINKALEKIEQHVESVLDRYSRRHYILVLDELDTIFHDTRNNPSDFVYKLLTIRERLGKKGYHLCIVGISNMPIAENNLEGRVISRIGSNRVFFADYTKDELFYILYNVAQRAFSVKITDSVLWHCADMCSEDHGDARQALDVLRSAGEICNGTVTESDIDSAAKKIQEDTFLRVILSSGYRQKKTFVSLARISFLTGRKWHSTMDIYRQYLKLGARHEKQMISYRRFSDILRELEQSGICSSRTSSKGRHGYNTEYILAIPAETVKFLNKELWEDWTHIKANRFCMKNGFYQAYGTEPEKRWVDAKQWAKYLGLEYFFDPKPKK